MKWLFYFSVAEMNAARSRLHVALTDFGCAMKTKGESVQCVQPSGNPALQAPEVATYFATPEMQRGIEPVDYSRADIWAAATIVYEIFGEENPFVSDVSVIMHIFSCYFITCPVVLARLTLTT